MLVDKDGNKTTLTAGDYIWYDKFAGTLKIIRCRIALIQERCSNDKFLIHNPGEPEINFLGFCELLAALCDLQIEEVEYYEQLITCRFK